jgi:cytochrome P450
MAGRPPNRVEGARQGGDLRTIAPGPVQAIVPAIGYDDLEGLPSMDLVFKETLRMNAPVGLVAREAIKETQIDGRYIPKGTRLMLGIYPTQRLEP